MLRLILLLSLAAALSGCALSEEDKSFYYRGWLNPRSLDDDYVPKSKKSGINTPPPAPDPGFKRDPLID